MAIATLLYSFVEQWSARQSVTLKIAGSIPVEAAIILKKEDFAYDCINEIHFGGHSNHLIGFLGMN